MLDTNHTKMTCLGSMIGPESAQGDLNLESRINPSLNGLVTIPKYPNP